MSYELRISLKKTWTHDLESLYVETPYFLRVRGDHGPPGLALVSDRP